MNRAVITFLCYLLYVQAISSNKLFSLPCIYFTLSVTLDIYQISGQLQIFFLLFLMFVQVIFCLYILYIMILFWQKCIMEQDVAYLGKKHLEIFFTGQLLLCSVIILVYLLRQNKKFTAPLLDGFVYNTDCPICFNELKLPIKSDCGHGYCIECLHTFWTKRTWKNICPLCRQPLKNLRLIENEENKYMETTREMLLQKVGEISKNHFRSFKFSKIIFSETAYHFIIGTFLLILWTWAVVNTDKLIQYSLQVYNSFYNTKKE